ncbi:hypothetical protein M404DRAFT_32109 [Pisolithus tinctorius Marx 270]|uniref:Uncharacterized protein n=1 Tax=Pisolithus tinctorius Marx 270 TaxID=870435 RepID=A0A0C3JJ57_PISTI|nr:hypothetical protein M404DRAFT_32109 [Pisolithus tinctorius Marx 270]
MAPKRDASQTKEASPPKRMRTTATSNDTTNQQTTAPSSLTATASNQPDSALSQPPSCSEPNPSSTPSTDTLPSTGISVTPEGPSPHQAAASQLQESSAPSHSSPSDSTLPPPTAITTSVDALVPVPESSSFDLDRISTCPDRLLSRIKLLSTYCNQDANTFALGHILPTATWGTADPYEDRSKHLVHEEWRSGQPMFSHDPYSIFKARAIRKPFAVRILLPETAQAFSCPFSSQSQTALFNSIYDAREVLKSKSSMTKLDISHLQKRALVLLETQLNRYRQKDENGRWTISKAQFELEAVYLLQDPYLHDPEQNIESGVEIPDLAI